MNLWSYVVAEAGYMDPKTMVVKFRKGLDPQIQNTIAMMAYGHLSDASLEDWYEAAKNIDQNCAANEAFKLAYWAPVSTCSPPNPLCIVQSSLFRTLLATHAHPALSKSAQMDTDGTRKKDSTLPICYRCHQPGYKAPDCPLRFNMRLLTDKELKNELMNRKDVPPMEILLMGMKYEIPKEEDFVQDNEWRACPCCPLIIISKH